MTDGANETAASGEGPGDRRAPATIYDIARLTGQFHPIRAGEAVIELSYRVQLTGWWQLQPDFQYVFNPAGGVANPNAPGRRVGDAAIFGLRTAITF